MERDAADGLGFMIGEEQAAFWQRVLAGEIGEFLVETLEAEAEAQGLGVFEEEFATWAIWAGDSAWAKVKGFNTGDTGGTG